MRKYFILLFLSILQFSAFAQLSVPGVPLSKQAHFEKVLPVIKLSYQLPPKQAQIKTNEPQPFVAGYTMSFNNSLLSKGVWEQAPTGAYVWRLVIQLDHANAINLYFKDFKLSPGDRLFLYNADETKVLGAFSRLNNGPFLATGYVRGKEIVIELDTKKKYQTLPFKIGAVGNITKVPKYDTTGFGTAGSCEVPVNCPEGNNYQNQKRGVARILLKSGDGLYWCTGTLVNNTRNDAKPYFLTANHCGQNASSADYAQWIFYFNYESPDCSRPSTEPAIQSLSGSKLLASAVNSTALGSDFKLLLLKNTVPLSYKPYFNGWDASGAISTGGVVIHHPKGDIKMISTYTKPLIPMAYYGTGSNPNALYWQVTWAATPDGHGVTEPGSSGAPLFNKEGLIIGSLTGGDAACETPNAPDYFGRFSKSWDPGSSDSTHQLKYWLDKNHLNTLQLPGMDPLSQKGIPFFTSNTQNVPIGGTVQFINLSTGPITSYHWHFEGGDPAISIQKTPPPIHYYKSGSYEVELSVSYPSGLNTLIKSSYISVKPVIYPNPVTDGKFHILLGNYNKADITITVYNMMGQRLSIFNPEFSQNGVTITLPHNQNGLYIIRLYSKGIVHTYKILNFHR